MRRWRRRGRKEAGTNRPFEEEEKGGEEEGGGGEEGKKMKGSIEVDASSE